MSRNNYPFDIPAAIIRSMPYFVIPFHPYMTVARAGELTKADIDESGLIAIHKGVGGDRGYTVTHPPTGVAYRQELTLDEAMDLGNWLAARLHLIRQLVLDRTTVNPNTATVRIAEDPGNIAGSIEEWERLRHLRAWKGKQKQ